MSTDPKSDIHLAAIRKALANGNAAVMVGAGFSLNAEGGSQLKTWEDIATELWNELNPGQSQLSSEGAKQIVTQLGEQYARVFSPPALENLLKKLIPDDKVNPGELHEKLLSLPWAEIFTTNYDTLIERAAENIVERAHYTVTCREDIPQSKVLGRRRIVKLHGSFPSQRPFIFTEEEYRRYPQDFAPFVNLVRQSLLENVFCLIGFSGEDPNFLHWIGWVRDMLDQHALPIYLFVGKEPSLGQLKLLEARNVTPVVLPSSNSNDASNYGARYSELFHILNTPLSPAITAWGKSIDIPSEMTTYTRDFETKYERTLQLFPTLVQLRTTYPGWLVAPQTVRRNLNHSLSRFPLSLESHDFYKQLILKAPLVGIVFLAQYRWQQDVLLESFDDRLAGIALQLLRITSDFDKTNFNSELPTLKRLGVLTLIDLQQYWRMLALGVLRWAREELHEDIFNELKRLLKENFPSDRELTDEVMHESILMALYQGERDIAQRFLVEWNIQSLNAYMEVRKGALLAEVGEAELGLKTCVTGLQMLRRKQKTNPENTRYLSEEAWACLIINNLQRAKTFFWTDAQPDSEDARLSEKISRRLSDLAAKDFDVRREQAELAAELNAEAPLPSEARYTVPQFDLGRYSSSIRFGAPSDLINKVKAAFSWLTLADRVSLVPRMGNVSFDLGSYTQAAWWAQYNDSIERVLSVAIRTLNSEILKPKDHTQTPHKTGWLSRFQVARVNETLAIQVCKRSLGLVERSLALHSSELKHERVITFHMEIFGRLIIRIQDPTIVFDYAERILLLHSNGSVSEHPRLWEVFGIGLSRCFEALPLALQQKLILQIALIPEVPQTPQTLIRDLSSDIDNWLPTRRFWIELEKDSWSKEILASLSSETKRLIKIIKATPSENKTELIRKSQAWARILWLDHLGLLTQKIRVSIGKILWNKTEVWPTIPNHYPIACYDWPAPKGVDVHASFQQWILSQRLPGFSSPAGVMVTSANSKTGWGLPANNTFLRQWIASLNRCAWSEKDIQAGLYIVKNWWDAERESIVADIPHLEELHSAFLTRLHLLDTILAKALEGKWGTQSKPDAILMLWLEEVIATGKLFGAHFLALRLSQAFHANNEAEFIQVQKELSSHLLNESSTDSSGFAINVVFNWIISLEAEADTQPELLLDTLCAIVAARRMPNLTSALHILIKIIERNAHWITDRLFVMIDLGLQSLYVELDYKKRPVGSNIPDEEVPILRLYCVRLAVAFIDVDPPRTSKAISEWIAQIQDDPLPEIRYFRK
jgi:hypothetical protein